MRALETHTSVRVIAEPHLLLRHSVPAQSRSVVNRPYVPSVSTAITGTTTAVASTTASAAQVPEGVTFTALANVVDSARISLWLVPQIVTMQELVQFKPSNDTTLTVPVVPVTEAAINVIAESGKTIVVGGLRRGRDARTAAGVPGATGIPFLRELLSGINDMDSETEVVMLVRASVIPAPRGVRILAAESL
ncbi:MAG: type II and III secretion system protein [Burkholderiales bacterium]|nr:MAG: type II and III secretion system protein [Burkholderiales bacterium]